MKGKFAWLIAGILALLGIGLGAYGIISVDVEELKQTMAQTPTAVLTKAQADRIAESRQIEVEKVEAVRNRIRNVRQKNIIEPYDGTSSGLVRQWNAQWRENLLSRMREVRADATVFVNVENTEDAIRPDPATPDPFETLNGVLSQSGTELTTPYEGIPEGLGRMAVSAVDTMIAGAESAREDYLADFPLTGPDLSAFHSTLVFESFNFDRFADPGATRDIYGDADPLMRREFTVSFLVNPRMMPYLTAHIEEAIRDTGMEMDIAGINLQTHRVPVAIYVRKEFPTLRDLYSDYLAEGVDTDPDIYDQWIDDPEGFSKLWNVVYLNPEEHEELSMRLTLTMHMLDVNPTSPVISATEQE